MVAQMKSPRLINGVKETISNFFKYKMTKQKLLFFSIIGSLLFFSIIGSLLIIIGINSIAQRMHKYEVEQKHYQFVSGPLADTLVVTTDKGRCWKDAGDIKINGEAVEFNGYLIKLASDSGKNWLFVTDAGGNRKKFEFVVPEGIKGEYIIQLVTIFNGYLLLQLVGIDGNTAGIELKLS